MMMNDDQIPEGARLVCSYDVAGSHEVDEGALFLLVDGTYLHRWASGGSCWDGEYSTETYETFEGFVRDNRMAHGSDYGFEPDFSHLASAFA